MSASESTAKDNATDQVENSTKPASSDPSAFIANVDDEQTSIPGFDGQSPPSQNLIDACVHCGFCLSTCPSYRVIGKEMDSPRGRIYLMNAINQGEAALTTTTAGHFDTCLGCLACVSTCPSGVQYDQLIAATRPQVERNVPRTVTDRLIRGVIFHLFPYPKRLRVLLDPLWLYQKSGLQKLVRHTGLLSRLSSRLAAMEANLPALDLEAIATTYPTIVPAQGEKRYRVGMILGCVQRLFFAPVNLATIRVLTANGCEVVIPPDQGCCAALPAHQGQEAQAQQMARQMIDQFADQNLDAVIINAAGCGHTLKEYGHILRDDPEYGDRARAFAAQVKDVQEFLMAVGLTAPLHPLAQQDITMVYQDACHLLHGQKISIQPRQLLQQIPGVTLREAIDGALCCGSAGVYSMLQPEVANELGQQKVRNLLNTGAQVIASPNPGCSLQIQRHLRSASERAVLLMHPMELLDHSIRNIKLSPD